MDASRWRSAATSPNSQSRKATILGNALVALGRELINGIPTDAVF
jgi:hypothetical protein